MERSIGIPKMIKLDPENNPDHRCLCGSKNVKPILFFKDPPNTYRIYCKPCYELQIWGIEDNTDWVLLVNSIEKDTSESEGL